MQRLWNASMSFASIMHYVCRNSCHNVMCSQAIEKTKVNISVHSRLVGDIASVTADVIDTAFKTSSFTCVHSWFWVYNNCIDIQADPKAAEIIGALKSGR